MGKLFLLISTLSVLLVNGQSNFSRGYSAGFDKGYCYNKGVGCINYNKPSIPIPRINENLNSYNDGYDRGFNDGLDRQKSESENNNNTANRLRYTTSKAEFIDKNLNLYSNSDNIIALAMVLKEAKAKAMEYLENEDYQAVAQICFAGLRASPKDNEFMLLLGQAYRYSGDKVNALKWFKKASYHRPGDNNLKTLIYNIENE